LDGGQPVARPLPTHRTAQTHRRDADKVGFEPTTPVFGSDMEYQRVCVVTTY
jgi:hypothetical protein